jgi:hypothetical protein
MDLGQKMKGKMIQKIRLPLSLSPRESDEQSSNSKASYLTRLGVGVVPWWPKETGVEKEMGSWVAGET